MEQIELPFKREAEKRAKELLKMQRDLMGWDNSWYYGVLVKVLKKYPNSHWEVSDGNWASFGYITCDGVDFFNLDRKEF